MGEDYYNSYKYCCSMFCCFFMVFDLKDYIGIYIFVLYLLYILRLGYLYVLG